MRIYNPSLGRFLSVDPIFRSYPELTPYQFASNRPIDGIDVDGLEYATFTIFVQNGKVKDISVAKDYELKNPHTAGPGVQINYAYLDKNGKITKFDAQPNQPNSVYGIYAGDKNPKLPDIDGDPYKLHDDYSLEPIDEVDAAAKKHDLAYDKLRPKQEGFSGVMSDASTIANSDASREAGEIMDRYKQGGTDKLTGKKITKDEFMGAWSIHDGFKAAEGVKSAKNAPGEFMKSLDNLINDIKTKTTEGINAINNWSPQSQ